LPSSSDATFTILGIIFPTTHLNYENGISESGKGEVEQVREERQCRFAQGEKNAGRTAAALLKRLWSSSVAAGVPPAECEATGTVATTETGEPPPFSAKPTAA
jgi:hypothetical protein